MNHWNEMPRLAESISEDHLFIVIAARKGTVSYKNALEHLPDEIKEHFSGKNLIIIFPDQHGDPMDEMTFAQPQHQEERAHTLSYANGCITIFQDYTNND